VSKRTMTISAQIEATENKSRAEDIQVPLEARWDRFHHSSFWRRFH
jgi:hypothetical protein